MTEHTTAAPLSAEQLDKLEAMARNIESTGAWDFDTADTPFRIAGGEVVGGDALPYGDVYTMKEWETPEGSKCLTIVQEVGTQFGKYIAAFDPPTALALIAQARAAQTAQTLDEAHLKQLVLDVSNASYFCGTDPERDGPAYAEKLDKAASAEAALIQYVQTIVRAAQAHHATATTGEDVRDVISGGLTTLLQAAGAMRMVRAHDGSGEPFAAYDKGITDRVVAELRTGMPALEDRIVKLRTALKDISEVRFGWDGDCGVTRIADDAIFADDEVQPK